VFTSFQEILKNLIYPLLIPLLSAFGGGWLGVQVALARMDTQLGALSDRVNRGEAASAEVTRLSAADRRELREQITQARVRIAKVESGHERVIELLRLYAEQRNGR